jgi:hypothetical protein
MAGGSEMGYNVCADPMQVQREKLWWFADKGVDSGGWYGEKRIGCAHGERCLIPSEGGESVLDLTSFDWGKENGDAD